tara:strand:+ start:1621 stop:3312 length:1692 start_codon:yes stop_codon:yes gene_type:complete
MAETLVSPGVLARENDQSQITAQPIQAGAAIIGPTVKGRVDRPHLVTSYSEYKANFGTTFTSGSNEYTYLTSIAAYNYFAQGGTSLLVTRVANGTFSPATASAHSSVMSASFTLETLAEGRAQNNSGSLGTNNILSSGSKDNVRWEVVSPNTSSGTFSLLIRRGDDNINQKVVLESYNNISLDPNQDNYISKVIGDMTEQVLTEDSISYLQVTGSYSNKSNYVRVSSVTNTVNYLDNNGDTKAEYVGLIPTAASGGFIGADGLLTATQMYQEIGSNPQGLAGSDYDTALSLLNNKDEYNYNLLVAPGITREGNSTVVSTMETQAQGRGDYLAVVDLRNYGSTVVGAIDEASHIDSSYAATYWPWVQTSDPDTGDLVWVPASTMIPGVMAYNDRVAASWFAPAGINRGGMGTVARAERKLTQSNRDDLYEANVNPIGTFPNSGVVVFGQKTMQKKASALDRVNVRRLLITLKDYISQIADTLVFEQNTIATRNSFLSQVNPYLQNVQQQQGLYAFKVVMDDTNNTPDVIDRNELKGQIFLQPTKTAEFIILDFNVTPTGAAFPA